MNLQHLKYMIEVERVGSITKAAANLFMGQPNLSKAIKEVENEIGITVFERSAKGVFPTDKGAVFLEYAKNIIIQMEKIESLYKPGAAGVIRFSVSVPRASYITKAFTEFVRSLGQDSSISLDFRETSSLDAISHVCDGSSSLAVIRYDLSDEEYFRSMIEEKNLRSEPLLRFDYRILLSAADPLASLDDIPAEALSGYTEIVHGDNRVPYLSARYTRRSEEGSAARRIYIYERGSQFDLLTEVEHTYMWVSPMPESTLRRLDLVQASCSELSREYADCIIYQSGSKLSRHDEQFISKLHKVRDEVKN